MKPDSLQTRHLTLAAGALVAALALAVIYFVIAPVTNDGAWYTYPSYALAKGGDPSENLPNVDLPAAESQRVVAKFGWENRSSLMVPVLAQWFRLTEPSWVQLKVFGALQILVLIALSGATAWLFSRNALLTLCVTVLVAADSTLLATGLRDIRPDLAVAIVSMALLGALALAINNGKHAYFIVAIGIAFLLPLVHVTAANAVVFFVALCGLWAFLDDGGQSLPFRRTCLIAVVVVLVAGFLLRQTLLDILVPTVVSPHDELPYQHSLVERLQRILAGGVLQKARLEAERWGGYFLVGNAANLLFFLAGVMGTVALIRTGFRSRNTRIACVLVVATVASCGFTVVLDPHPTRGHTLVVGTVGLVAMAAVIGQLLVLQLWTAARIGMFCTVVLGLAGVMKVAHAAHTYDRFHSVDLTNSSVERILDTAIPRGPQVRIIGPSEMWPYLTHRSQPIRILDYDRSVTGPTVMRGNFDGASLLVINDEYVRYGWLKVVADLRGRGLIEKVSAIGNCEISVDCLEIYRVVATTPVDR